ncbi:MAG TPA: class I SAM-dependent methyltransferase [Vitreimonas sp.]|nr:class I SAM-dependent methyltransferase [Vitreimonas sp.]
MTIKLEYPTGWSDYQLLDSGDGEKLERFGEFVLRRPDPQIIWSKTLPVAEWQRADAAFERTQGDKGVWKFKTKMPQEWLMHWEDMATVVKLSPFKHTGVFPEQGAQWQWLRQRLAEAKTAETATPLQVLNLFAYTGMASMVCAKAGAKVTHVDASRAAIGWAKQNQLASGLDERSVRWILDDVVKFVSREVRREVKYDGIILDPPVYGHGPNGETWEFKESLPLLLDLCSQILSDKPLFIVMNAYAVSTSAVTLGNVMSEMMSQHPGEVQVGELALQEAQSQRSLSTGIWARWQRTS